ncbi:MAG: UbiH/UbiF family hydroxylase [Hyphomicrobiales bacterium]|nr:UbiH/UbiF family hydroxylase [Hyphomicrobiales bacterium]
MSSTRDNTDILVIGAGATGLAAALALARTGRSVTLVGRPESAANGRTVAMLEGSLRLMQNLGVLESMRPDLAALETMRIVDDTGSLFRTPPVEFLAHEIGLDLFGENIENIRLVAHLAQAARREPNLTFVEDIVTGIDLRDLNGHVTTAAGRSLSAHLLVAADGRKSRLRAAANIATREWSYKQEALTFLLQHDRPHRDTSTEFHTRQGPFTLVPLPASAEARHRSSLVWLMSPEEARRRRALADAALVREIERQAHHILGRMRLEPGRGGFAMTGMTARSLSARRVVLIGDAAHGFPPIGAQGLNLGLRDAAHLADCLAGDDDPGSDEVLARYETARQGDIRLRTLGVDLLNRSLLTPFAAVDAVRGLGLSALATIAPLRRMAMREGVMPRGLAPSLMRLQGVKSL